MTLRQEIAELCKTIHIFQTNIAPLKQQLFNIPIITKNLIWNHVIGSTYQRADAGQILIFFKKHGISITKRDVSLVNFVYSSKKDGFVTCNDFWNIFKPLHIKFINQIMGSRAKNESLAKFHQAHYKISDLLCVIMKKTVQFLTITQQMKENIVIANAQDIKIQPLDPAHLQIFINPYAPSLLVKDVEIIFKHIMRNEVKCSKTFQQFFIPLGYQGRSVFNPNYVREYDITTQIKGLQSMKHHWQNVAYMDMMDTKKPIYLDDKYNRRKVCIESSK